MNQFMMFFSKDWIILGSILLFAMVNIMKQLVPAEEKLRYEIEKLQLEIKEKRSLWNPTLVLAITMALISLSGNIFQWSNSRNEKTLADIKVAQANLDSEKAEARLKTLQQQIDLATATYERTNQQIAEAEQRLQETTAQVNESQAPQVHMAVAEIKTILGQARQSNNEAIEDLQRLPQQTVPNHQIAESKEQEGFEKLITGDYAGSAQAFKDSDKAFPGFHNAYELFRIINTNRSNFDDPVKRKEIIRTIATKYSYGAKREFIEKLKNISR
jgi:hypothetical protein